MVQVVRGLTSAFQHGRAFTQRLAPAAPAAGAGFTIPIQSPYWERWQVVTFTLTSSNQAANRLVTLSVLDSDGTVIGYSPATAVQTASHAVLYSFLANIASQVYTTNTSFLLPLPSFFLQPGWQVQVAIANVQTNDQVSGIRVVTERFVTGDGGYLLGVQDEGPIRAAVETLGD